MSESFKALGVPDYLIRGIVELGFSSPTEIQESAIPFLLEDGGDLIGQAQTGTGKTAAFGLPLLTKIDPDADGVQGLVVAPTRELAKQIGKHLFRFSKYAEDKVFVEVLSGGDKIGQQVARLQRPTQIIVATPGRLLDLVKRGAVTLDSVTRLILDEADEMLSLGFSKELGKIIELVPGRKSTWIFSATFPDKLESLIRGCMSHDARRITVDGNHVVNRDISHKFAFCDRAEKTDFISDFLRGQEGERGMIFCRTKAGAIALGNQLQKLGHGVGVIQGDLSQQDRDKVMRGFKKGRTQFLIATDVAARGIDVEGLSFVLHHQPPDQIEYYTHRSGRTARAGKTGQSVVLVEARERKRIEFLEKELGVSFSRL